VSYGGSSIRILVSHLTKYILVSFRQFTRNYPNLPYRLYYYEALSYYLGVCLVYSGVVGFLPELVHPLQAVKRVVFFWVESCQTETSYVIRCSIFIRNELVLPGLFEGIFLHDPTLSLSIKSRGTGQRLLCLVKKILEVGHHLMRQVFGEESNYVYH